MVKEKMGICRRGRICSKTDLEHFLGEGGGGKDWAVAVAVVVGLGQWLLISSGTKESAGLLVKMQTLGPWLQKF